MSLLVFGLLCFVWGFSWVAIKLTLEGFPPFLGAGLRFLLAVPLLALFVAWRRVPVRLPMAVVKLVFVTAVLTYAFDYGLIYWAEQHLSAGVTAILFATFPIFTGLFSRWLLPGERLGAGVFIGLLLGFGGVFVTYSDSLGSGAAADSVSLATAAVVVGAAGGALATVLIKKDLVGLHPATLTLWQMMFGSVGLLAFSMATETRPVLVPGWPALFGLAYLSVIASALAFSLYYWLLSQSRAVSVSTMIFVTPIVALLADAIVFGGGIRLRVIAGMMLVFSGIAVAELPRYRSQFERLRNRHRAKARRESAARS
ncbi:MAG: EamA family transporter [Acidobacteriota bacterium]